jgi:hypothetical protein
MSNIDSRVATLLDTRPSNNTDSDDEDALIASLEEDSLTDGFREQRLQQLHSEFTRAKQQKAQGYGVYHEIKDEKELMEITASAERSVVHFRKEGFVRCGVMDGELGVCFSSLSFGRLNAVKGGRAEKKWFVEWVLIFEQKLATKHTDTRFLKMDVDNAPFLVVKLKIQVLPCVISFTKGQTVDRIIGFEGLGFKQDSFTAKDLETRLLGCGVILRAKSGLEDVPVKSGERSNGGAIRFGVKKKMDDDSDDEWD